MASEISRSRERYDCCSTSISKKVILTAKSSYVTFVKPSREAAQKFRVVIVNVHKTHSGNSAIISSRPINVERLRAQKLVYSYLA